MEVTEDVFGMFVLVLSFVDFRIKDKCERSPGRENLPCLLLRRLLGDSIIYDLDRTADDLFNLCNDIGLSINDVRGA